MLYKKSLKCDTGQFACGVFANFVSGQNIKEASQVQYLGVILQDDLHWDMHLPNLAGH